MSRSANDTEPYIRSTDGARMIAIEPGVFVNETVWKLLRVIKVSSADLPAHVRELHT